jgi:hypothetical protein
MQLLLSKEIYKNLNMWADFSNAHTNHLLHWATHTIVIDELKNTLLVDC